MLNNRQIQITLWYLNFYHGQINGKYNLQTKNACKNFQKSFELTQDGIWGIKTNTKAVSLIKEIQSKIGCTMIDGIVLYKTGETYEKTKQFQLLNNLEIDGIAGVQTRAKIFNNSKLTWDDFPHFKRSEFACKDKCGFDDENLKVVEILEDIRAHFGNHPVIITSRL